MSMKVIGITAHGTEDALTLLQVAKPVCGAQDLLVKVLAFALNPVDYKIREGHLGGPVQDNLKILGWDASGIVESVGSDAKGFKAGDEVYFAGSIVRPGANAEYVAVDYRLAALKPTSVSHLVAGSMPLTALTAWEAFEDKFHVQIPKSDDDAIAKLNASKSVLITAGAGGVGSIAIQLAKKVFKLGKVVATAGRAESATWCRKMGADVILDRNKDWKAELTDNGIEGIDYVLACAGMDDIFEKLISLVHPCAHICGIVVASQPYNVAALFGKSLTFSYEFMGSRPIHHYQLERQGEILAQLATYVDNGSIVSWIGLQYETATVENLRAGHIHQQSGSAVGKIAYVATFP